MRRFAAFTGGRTVPSARFRVRQYIPRLRDEGIEIVEFMSGPGSYPPPARWRRPFWAVATLAARLQPVVHSHHFDGVILQREMMSGFSTLERLTKSPRVLDVDDAIFLLRGGGFARKLAVHAEKVICGNEYLADWFRRWNRNVVVIPTAVDTDRYMPQQGSQAERAVPVIGWIGSSANYEHLYAIDSALHKVILQNPRTRLKIIGDQPPNFRHVPAGNVDFIAWSEANEVEAIQSMGVGIMPLQDTPWARGKCSYKMLQYMAAGLPVVVSPVGMNAEILKLGELGIGATSERQWTEGLVSLLEDSSLRARFGLVGRRLVESSFSLSAVVPRLARVLREC